MGRRENVKKKYHVNYGRLFVSIAVIILITLVVIYGIKYWKNSGDNKIYYEDNIKIYNEIVPKEPEEYTLKITTGGDLLIHDTVFNAAKKSDGGYDFTTMFDDIKYLFEESDLGMINLEVPVAGNIYPPSNYPNFNSPVELLDGIKYMGIDIVSTANNHALDKGLKGLNETLKNARSKELTVIGTYDTEDTKPAIIEKNSIKLGIASYTYGTNGIPIPDSAPYCVNIIDKDKMLKDIIYLKEQNVDFIIFNMHFGQEYQTTQNSTQEDLVNFLVENGVDVVFGSHPHVPQPYQIKETTLNNGITKKSFVIYSLGNFISNQTDYYTKLGGVASVTLSKKGDVKQIVDYKVTPIYTLNTSISGKKTFKVVPLEKAIYEYDAGVSTTYSQTQTNTFRKLLTDASSIYEKLQ